jgi:hypothetical protein
VTKQETFQNISHQIAGGVLSLMARRKMSFHDLDVACDEHSGWSKKLIKNMINGKTVKIGSVGALMFALDAKFDVEITFPKNES